MIPSDPYILLSYVNMKLRDEFSSAEDLAASLDIDLLELNDKLSAIQYHYDPSVNQYK